MHTLLNVIAIIYSPIIVVVVVGIILHGTF